MLFLDNEEKYNFRDINKPVNEDIRKTLLDLLAENKIDYFYLDSWKRRLSIEFQKDFTALADKLKMRPQVLVTEKNGVMDFFEYESWTISSNRRFPSRDKEAVMEEVSLTYNFERIDKSNKLEPIGW